jgi:hypothetical protein
VRIRGCRAVGVEVRKQCLHAERCDPSSGIDGCPSCPRRSRLERLSGCLRWPRA